MWVERLKWPDVPHYRHLGWVLGDDEYGLWIELRVGTPVYRRDEILFHGANGGLMLAPKDQGWLAWFPEFGEFDLYVDIVTGLIRTDEGVTMVDLDLDVIRYRGGEVQLLDEDEFALHQVKFSYPPEIVEGARRQAEFVLNAVRVGAEPFGGQRAAEWTAKVNH